MLKEGISRHIYNTKKKKKIQVQWEELAGWVASFSYHVVCCAFLRGLAPCKVYLYMCVAFA